MKAFVSFILCILFVLGMLGCSNQNSKPLESETQTSKEYYSEDINMRIDSFDREKKNKPTNKDVEKIEKGMSFSDVVSILGRPHGWGVPYVSSSTRETLNWTTVEGNICLITFGGTQKLEVEDGFDYYYQAVVLDVSILPSSWS